jgi:hypothetical protein
MLLHPQSESMVERYLTPDRLVFERELQLLCDLLFLGTLLTVNDQAANLMDHLHEIHSYGRQNLHQTKTRYDRLANCASYKEGDNVWLYRPTRMKRKSPKLQSSWEGQCKVVMRVNVVVYRSQ